MVLKDKIKWLFLKKKETWEKYNNSDEFYLETKVTYLLIKRQESNYMVELLEWKTKRSKLSGEGAFPLAKWWMKLMIRGLLYYKNESLCGVNGRKLIDTMLKHSFGTLLLHSISSNDHNGGSKTLLKVLSCLMNDVRHFKQLAFYVWVIRRVVIFMTIVISQPSSLGFLNLIQRFKNNFQAFYWR